MQQCPKAETDLLTFVREASAYTTGLEGLITDMKKIKFNN